MELNSKYENQITCNTNQSLNSAKPKSSTFKPMTIKKFEKIKAQNLNKRGKYDKGIRGDKN